MESRIRKSMSENEIEKYIKALVKEFVDLGDVNSTQEIDYDTPLVDLGLDDLDSVELIMNVEDKCQILIEDSDIDKIKLDSSSTNEFIKFIIEKVKSESTI